MSTENTTATTQLLAARAGTITEEMRTVAGDEFLPVETIRAAVAAGRVVIPINRRRGPRRPAGIGRILRTKINANLGDSAQGSGADEELAKLDLAIKYGADAVMDLSTGPRADEIRARILARSTAPVGTVPVYQAAAKVGDIVKLSPDDLVAAIATQAEQGVDFMTVHAGLLREFIPLATKRLLGIVSRGGALLAKWMTVHQAENPFYTEFDRILAICRAHDVTLSLGDALRPGCLADASDEAQFAELRALGGLVRRCRDAGVQVMVEGPGHVPMDEIEMNMRIEEELCDGAPFYILGPVVTDCAPGYDHITSAIGAALGGFHGAAMLCCVTPREHLGLPDAEDLRNGVIAYKIAAHAADIALKRPHARERDDAMSRARAAFDWRGQFDLALDPERARELHRPFHAAKSGDGTCAGEEAADACTMCGPDFCPIRIAKDLAAMAEGAAK